MPLRNGYCLLVGKIIRYYPRYGYGNHVKITILADGKAYEVAVNTYSRDNTHLEYHYDPHYDHEITRRLEKLHEGLYIKGSSLPRDLELDFKTMDLFNKDNFSSCTNQGNKCTDLDNKLLNLAEDIHDQVCGECTFYIFGEPYSSGLGIHNVHMNQGSSNPRFAHEAGPGQDGCMFVRRGDGTFSAYFSKFKTQTL